MTMSMSQEGIRRLCEAAGGLARRLHRAVAGAAIQAFQTWVVERSTAKPGALYAWARDKERVESEVWIPQKGLCSQPADVMEAKRDMWQR
eukprot:4311079-Lingulodinium_polyedra.AAC.1